MLTGVDSPVSMDSSVKEAPSADLAIDGNAIAWFDDDSIAKFQLRNRRFNLGATCIEPACDGGRNSIKPAKGPGGSHAHLGFHPMTDADQGDNGCRLHEEKVSVPAGEERPSAVNECRRGAEDTRVSMLELPTFN